MSILTLKQTVEISDVTDVKVTEIVEEGAGFVRAIRIYGAPAGENAPLILDLRIKSANSASLNVTTPVLEF